MSEYQGIADAFGSFGLKFGVPAQERLTSFLQAACARKIMVKQEDTIKYPL